MRSFFILVSLLALTGLQLVHADGEKETTQYTFGSRRPITRELTKSSSFPRRSTSSSKRILKPAFKASSAENVEKEQPEIKKRVRFFVQEDGDLNLLDNQGNDYMSTDEENALDHDENDVNDNVNEQDDEEERIETNRIISSFPSPLPQTEQQQRLSSWSSTSRQNQERRLVIAQSNAHQQQQQQRQQERQQQQRSASADFSDNFMNRQAFDYGTRAISSATMQYKRDLNSRIRMTESKIEFLHEMIAEQKKERSDAAKFNLLRAKLIDFTQQNRIWTARIRLLKHELGRQEEEYDYYQREMVVVQRRLQSALRRSQRSPLNSF